MSGREKQRRRSDLARRATPTRRRDQPGSRTTGRRPRPRSAAALHHLAFPETAERLSSNPRSSTRDPDRSQQVDHPGHAEPAESQHADRADDQRERRSLTDDRQGRQDEHGASENGRQALRSTALNHRGHGRRCPDTNNPKRATAVLLKGVSQITSHAKAATKASMTTRSATSRTRSVLGGHWAVQHSRRWRIDGQCPRRVGSVATDQHPQVQPAQECTAMHDADPSVRRDPSRLGP